MSGPAIIGVGIFFILWLCPFFLKLVGYGILKSISFIRWTLILLLFIGFSNVPQMYEYLGWTPMSLVFGKKLYDNKEKWAPWLGVDEQDRPKHKINKIKNKNVR